MDLGHAEVFRKAFVHLQAIHGVATGLVHDRRAALVAVAENAAEADAGPLGTNVGRVEGFALVVEPQHKVFGIDAHDFSPLIYC